MSKTILAIDSGCDETACAIIKDDVLLCNVISSQVDVHAKYGGVMPEIASRLHAENIIPVIDEALNKANIKLEEIDAFAVTRGPGLIGALHVGLQAAKSLALIYNKPLIPVHHLAGHIYANTFIKPFIFPLLAIVVSGGNSEFVLMKEDLDFQIIGQTKDDAIGECFDKVARVLGLPYPGGVHIDNHAKNGKHTYHLPHPMASSNYDLSYSGLKSNIINLVNHAKQKNEEINIDDLARSFQDTACNMIIEKVKHILRDFDVKQIVLAGGVSANSYLRSEMEKLAKDYKKDIILPPLWATTDNAAMIAKVACLLYDRKVFANLDIGSDPNWQIEDYLKFE